MIVFLLFSRVERQQNGDSGEKKEKHKNKKATSDVRYHSANARKYCLLSFFAKGQGEKFVKTLSETSTRPTLRYYWAQVRAELLLLIERCSAKRESDSKWRSFCQRDWFGFYFGAQIGCLFKNINKRSSILPWPSFSSQRAAALTADECWDGWLCWVLWWCAKQQLCFVQSFLNVTCRSKTFHFSENLTTALFHK